MLYSYNKLIRDKNVEIIEKKGCKVTYEVLNDKRYREELDKKLKEEVNEYLEAYDIEEMADVMEVIYAMLDYTGVTMEEVEKIRLEKQNRKGGFKNKIYLKDVEEE
ncbi:MAG: nucleoside triphosphate pyrophosphohydrolase [Clostridia bacterium]|nr:nucleoside triphosphate pyrophosphohydrolase [Clostridia bacterium]